MKLREINERKDWTFWVPDHVADWGAPSHWERERLASMERHIRRGMRVWDIGVEHGWLTAVIGSFCGHRNMGLFEPSPEFWPNIRRIWERNGFPEPELMWQAFVGDTWMGDIPENPMQWPACSDGPECDAQAYRSLMHPEQREQVSTVAVDQVVDLTGLVPDVLNIDIEGAEMLALVGARETLRLYRPQVWVSIHPDLMLRDFHTQPASLLEVMDEIGYHSTLLAVDHEEHWYFR